MLQLTIAYGKSHALEKAIQLVVESGLLTGMANCGRGVSAMVVSDREVVKLYLLLLCIVKQLANIVSSQHASLDGSFVRSSPPSGYASSRTGTISRTPIAIVLLQDRTRCWSR